jgi:hypothetical protein
MDKIGVVARWDAHMGAELFNKDADATMATMTADPYVNHVPTMTGGVGAAELHRFYKHHFIPRQPDDLEIVPVSRCWFRPGFWNPAICRSRGSRLRRKFLIRNGRAIA